MTFSPLTKASAKLRLPPFAISVSRQGKKNPAIILRILMTMDYAREHMNAKAGDFMQILVGDKGTSDEGYLLIYKTAGGLMLRAAHGGPKDNRLHLGTTLVDRLGALRHGTLEPEDVTFPKPNHIQFRIPAALMPIPDEQPAIASVVKPPAKNSRLGCPNDPMQPPLPPGHPKRNVTPAIKVNGNGHEAPRVVLTNEPAPAVRGSVMS